MKRTSQYNTVLQHCGEAAKLKALQVNNKRPSNLLWARLAVLDKVLYYA